MKVLTLCGKSNVGKSTTLRLLIETLDNTDGFNVDVTCNSKTITKPISAYNGDLRCLCIYKKYLIGITTRGDRDDILQNEFDVLNREHKCDLIICASHTKGKTLLLAEKMSHGDDFVVHSKWYVQPKNKNKENKINKCQVDFLIEEIKALLP